MYDDAIATIDALRKALAAELALREQAEAERDRYRMLAGTGHLVIVWTIERGVFGPGTSLAGLLGEMNGLCPNGSFAAEVLEQLDAQAREVARIFERRT